MRVIKRRIFPGLTFLTTLITLIPEVLTMNDDLKEGKKTALALSSCRNGIEIPAEVLMRTSPFFVKGRRGVGDERWGGEKGGKL